MPVETQTVEPPHPGTPESMPAPSAPGRRDRPRLRMSPRAIGVMAVLFAIGWCGGSWWVGLKYLRDLEMAHGISKIFIMATMMQGAQPPGQARNSRSAPRMTPEEQLAAMEEAQRQTILVEITRRCWTGVMWLVGGWTLVAGVAGIFKTRRCRGMLRIAAIFLFLSTYATYTGIYALVAHGGLPPLSLLTVTFIVLVQASFGLFLMIATGHRRVPVG